MDDKKKILNELAIISDQLEKISIITENKIVTINLNKENFEKLYTLITNNKKVEINEFDVIIGQVNYKFNNYNV